ncbi:intraflagellar transport protein 56-like [Ciona intestinalis]
MNLLSPESGILSRQKPAVGGASALVREKEKSKEKKLPKVDDLLTSRDYTGAMTVLEFNKQAGKGEKDTDSWIGFCAFHLGDYKKAYEVINFMFFSKCNIIICYPYTNYVACFSLLLSMMIRVTDLFHLQMYMSLVQTA